MMINSRGHILFSHLDDMLNDVEMIYELQK